MSTKRYEARDADIVALARAGTPQAVIGRMYGITRARVNQIVRRNGFVAPPPSINHVRQARSYAGRLREQARRLIVIAESFEAIAEDFQEPT